MSRSRQGETQLQPVPRSIADKVAQERVAVVSHNVPADSRFKGRSIVMQSVRSAMCSPLLDPTDEVLGLLYVDNISSPTTFTDEDLQFLVAFAGLAAIGVQNSRYAEQIRREATVRSNFERYFAPNIASEIAQQDQAVRVGGERRPITVLFSDIRGFTAMAESMGPDAVARLLSEYFSEMVEVIFEHGGTLDKFIGDAIMALWGAPISHTDDPDRALEAALAMQAAIAKLNAGWAEAGRPEIGVGIGINHGDVFAGNIGRRDPGDGELPLGRPPPAGGGVPAAARAQGQESGGAGLSGHRDRRHGRGAWLSGPGRIAGPVRLFTMKPRRRRRTRRSIGGTGARGPCGVNDRSSPDPALRTCTVLPPGPADRAPAAGADPSPRRSRLRSARPVRPRTPECRRRRLCPSARP
jgi:class 3 adenylate cyclase